MMKLNKLLPEEKDPGPNFFNSSSNDRDQQSFFSFIDADGEKLQIFLKTSTHYVGLIREILINKRVIDSTHRK